MGLWGVLAALAMTQAAGVDAGRPEAQLSKSEIAVVVRQHQGEIAACYKAELARRPSATGKVTADFTIQSDGSVSAASLASDPDTTLQSPSLEACFVHAITSWRFPHPKGEGLVHATYPWMLRSSSTASDHDRSFAIELSHSEGGLSPGEMKVLLQNEDLEACYDRELARRPSAEGQTTVLLTIEADGSVGSVRLAGYPQTTLWSQFIEDCFIARIKTWRFPPLDGGRASPITASYTLKLKR